MRPAKAKFKKFKKDPKYVHMRSEGLTRRQNGGTRRLVLDQADTPSSTTLPSTGVASTEELMATFVLIHGGGGSAWDWHLVEPELRRLGHEAIAVDLPCEDESAGLQDYADTVIEAIGDRAELVVVAHSLGGFTGPLVCARLKVNALIMLAAMIPVPGETVSQWWDASGYTAATREQDEQADDVFYHDVPDHLAAEARRRERNQADAAMEDPWPLTAWPSVPTRFLLCGQDRLFPAEWMRGVIRERLGITPDVFDSGHYASLAQPVRLAARLHSML